MAIKRQAVENFLSSMDWTMPIGVQLANLARDAKLYGWNIETKRTIRDGIRTIYQEKIS
jgi:hypothetical protein